MNRLINWMNESFAPKVNKFAQNVWVKALQRTMIATLPIILVGSIVNIITTCKMYFPILPDLSTIYYYTFYLLGLFVAIMTPYYVAEGKRKKKIQLISIITSVGVFLMLQKWNLNPWGETGIMFTNLGPQGIVLAIIGGYFVSYIMCRLADFSFFGENSVLPDFVTSWFNQMLPIAICFAIPFVIVYLLDFNILNAITEIFAPIQNISNTLGGFVLINFLYVFFYSIGASGWILSGAFYPILIGNIALNGAAVAAGNPVVGVATNEVIYSGWCAIGGLGCTLPLVLYMLKSKSKKLKGIAKGAFIPTLCNINEPIVYGAPIILNPILMIPMWINSIVIPIIVYFALTLGFVTIPSQALNLGFIPTFISCFLVNYDLRSYLLLAVAFAVACVVWLPFFKVYETQVLKDENNGEGK